MLVFDDLVIVGHPINDKGLFSSKKRDKEGKLLRVLPENEGGLGRVVDVKDCSGWQGKPYTYFRLASGI